METEIFTLREVTRKYIVHNFNYLSLLRKSISMSREENGSYKTGESWGRNGKRKADQW